MKHNCCEFQCVRQVVSSECSFFFPWSDPKHCFKVSKICISFSDSSNTEEGGKIFRKTNPKLDGEKIFFFSPLRYISNNGTLAYLLLIRIVWWILQSVAEICAQHNGSKIRIHTSEKFNFRVFSFAHDLIFSAFAMELANWALPLRSWFFFFFFLANISAKKSALTESLRCNPIISVEII